MGLLDSTVFLLSNSSLSVKGLGLSAEGFRMDRRDGWRLVEGKGLKIGKCFF